MTPPTSPSHTRKILLLGAGELGSAILPHILSLPSTSIALGVRSPSKYQHLTTNHPSLTLLPLDLTSPSPSLVPTFAEYDVIISATGYAQSPATLLKLATEIIAASTFRLTQGQGKIWFFPWQFGVDYSLTSDVGGYMPLFGAQKSIREVLRQNEEVVDWTVVSVGMFMSFLFEGFWGIIETHHKGGVKDGGECGAVKVRALNSWMHKVSVTHEDDIGRVVGRILAGDVAAKNKVVYVAGETLRYGELADVISRVTGREVQREVWSVRELKEEVDRDPGDEIKRYRLAFAGEGVSWDKAGTVNEVLGMEMVGVEEYARTVVFKK